MGDLIKIVGVQYAVNSNHVKGEDMTAQEQQKTIEFLTMLDRKHPYVSVKPEPTNETDEEAFVARFASRKAGYVRNREEYKSLAQAALTTSGRGYFRARVKEVIISAEGYFFVEAETDSTPIVPILHKDHWKEWEPPLPLFPMTEEFLCVEDATMMMIDILRHETLTSDEEEELQEYTETLITMGKYALWYEAKEGIENVIKAMEAKKGDKMRYMANELEHLLSGLCNEGRQKKLRKSWLPHLLSTHEAERAWHDWLHLKGADCHKPDNLKAKETLIQVGEMKGQYRFILGTELYNKLSESKVIKEAAIRSGVSVGVMQVCWDAAGEVIKAWCTEGHSVAVPGLGTMRFGVRAKSVPTVGEVATSLITNRRVIFTPSVDIKRELQETSIQITCYDRNGKVVKNVTSDDKGDVEDPDNTPGGGGSDNTPGGGNTEGGGTTGGNEGDGLE